MAKGAGESAEKIVKAHIFPLMLRFAGVEAPRETDGPQPGRRRDIAHAWSYKSV